GELHEKVLHRHPAYHPVQEGGLTMAQPLPRRYIAFDVETPNRNSDRMSAIGLTVVEDGAVLQSYYTLVNPEVPFDPFHIRLTGITPAMAAEAPTFSELWPSLAPL